MLHGLDLEVVPWRKASGLVGDFIGMVFIIFVVLPPTSLCWPRATWGHVFDPWVHDIGGRTRRQEDEYVVRCLW